MKRWISVCLVVAALCAGFGLAAAVTVSVSPDHIRSGDRVTVNVNGLPEDAVFSLLLDSAFEVNPGAEFSFEAHQFEVPFSLTGGTVTAVMDNTTSNRLSVKRGDSVVTLSGSSKGGEYRTTSSYEISSGTYDVISLGGRASNTSGKINARLELRGAKKGPDTGGISFTVEGITDGVIYVTALVDGKQVLYQPVLVGTTTAAAGLESVKTSESGYKETPDSSGGDDFPVGTRITVTVSPEPRGTSSGTPASGRETPSRTPSPVVTFASVDGALSGYASGPAYIGVVRVDPVGIPAGWVAVRGAYALSPENSTFTGPAGIRFALADGMVPDPGLVVARQSPGGWQQVPTGIENGTVTAEITGTGTYGLFTLPHPPTTAPPVITTTASLPATTKKSPLSLLPVIAACAGMALLFHIRRLS